MWAKNGNLPNGILNWYQAIDFCNNLSLCGYTDWGLPHVNELESLINANEGPFMWLTTQGFTNVQAGIYWSSTTDAHFMDAAWLVSMHIGDVRRYWKSDYSICVWPVCDGETIHASAQVWKTGQTASYYVGDGGDLERGVPRPSPRFADHGNGTVTDNLTGLMWTKNANLPNVNMTWQQALNYVAGMNAGTYPNFGYTDWRLPNRKELFSLIDHSRYNPALPADHPFTNVQTSGHFSSTSVTCLPDGPRCVGMGDGYVAYVGDKYYDPYYPWPVRGPEPTVITLSSFTATSSDRKVILTWTTASEIDNAGFNLYRSVSEGGDYLKINSSLIQAKGSPTQGASYQYVDETVKNRKTYYYKLEDIDLNGTSTMHGPVSVEVKRFGVRD
jgi:hypothetical protein